MFLHRVVGQLFLLFWVPCIERLEYQNLLELQVVLSINCTIQEDRSDNSSHWNRAHHIMHFSGYRGASMTRRGFCFPIEIDVLLTKSLGQKLALLVKQIWLSPYRFFWAAHMHFFTYTSYTCAVCSGVWIDFCLPVVHVLFHNAEAG